MSDEQDSGRTNSNPGAGQNKSYGGGSPHRLGQGPRDGDAGGTKGAGTRKASERDK